MSRRALALVAAVLAFGLRVGSASAAPIPFFYLVPSGPTTVPTVVPEGTSTYQLWVDPSGINAPGCTINLMKSAPINGACFGAYGIDDNRVLATGSLTMTAFSGIGPGGPAFTFPNLQSCPFQQFRNCTAVLLFDTGDFINGNATPFEIGK